MEEYEVIQLLRKHHIRYYVDLQTNNIRCNIIVTKKWLDLHKEFTNYKRPLITTIDLRNLHIEIPPKAFDLCIPVFKRILQSTVSSCKSRSCTRACRTAAFCWICKHPLEHLKIACSICQLKYCSVCAEYYMKPWRNQYKCIDCSQTECNDLKSRWIGIFVLLKFPLLQELMSIILDYLFSTHVFLE